jgi:acetoin utilization deacetylase AcuC-like enzyme
MRHDGVVIVVASDLHRRHHGVELHNGEFAPSVESPERADLIADTLRNAGHTLVEPRPEDETLHRTIRTVHTAEYVEFLATAWDRWVERGESSPAAMGHTWPPRGVTGRRPADLIGQFGYHSFAADSTIGPGTWAAASQAAAIAAATVDQVIDGGTDAYGLCRPPGHHATADQCGGYCYLNNAAVAAQRWLDRGATRVAVLDVDYHHGNGTQSIFYDRADVLFVSVHADPVEEFPWFAGHADETGRGDGEGLNLNLPLPRGTGAVDWVAALDVGLEHIGRTGVDALVISLGVDTHVDDPLGTFGLTTADIGLAGRRVADLDLPTAIVQEGGYATTTLGTNVAAFLAAS